MLSILQIPKVRLILCLIAIYITALITFPSINTLNPLICVGFCVFFDLLFTYFRKKTLFIPYAAIATGLIMALIINQSASILQIAVSAALAMGIKNFLRISGRHIFNPVTSGLFLAGIIFGDYIGWWGVSFQKINEFNLQSILFFLILISPGVISLFRFKKYFMFVTYLLTTVVISQLFFPVYGNFLTNLFSMALNPSTLFFALVMLPEPMTSPVTLKNQIIYGAIVATIPFIFSIPAISGILQNIAFDPLLFALLLGNLIFFKNN